MPTYYSESSEDSLLSPLCPNSIPFSMHTSNMFDVEGLVAVITGAGTGN